MSDLEHQPDVDEPRPPPDVDTSEPDEGDHGDEPVEPDESDEPDGEEPDEPDGEEPDEPDGDEPDEPDEPDGEEPDGDDVPRPPIEGSVASLLEQAQEEIAALHFDNASLLRDNEVLSAKVTTLEETIESIRDELATTTAREQAMDDIFGRLPELRAWSVSEGRDTRFILAADMIEAAKIAHETGGAPDRVLLVPKPIIWPSYVARP